MAGVSNILSGEISVNQPRRLQLVYGREELVHEQELFAGGIQPGSVDQSFAESGINVRSNPDGGMYTGDSLEGAGSKPCRCGRPSML